MSFQVGDLVWAKIRGYPLWPGMVMDLNAAPSFVQAARRPKKHAKSFLVLYLGTMEFGWVEPRDLKKYVYSLDPPQFKRKFRGYKEGCLAIMDIFRFGESSIYHPNAANRSTDEAKENVAVPIHDTETEANSSICHPNATNRSTDEAKENVAVPTQDTETEIKSSICHPNAANRSTDEAEEKVAVPTQDTETEMKSSICHPNAANRSTDEAEEKIVEPGQGTKTETQSPNEPLDLNKISHVLRKKRVQASTLKFGFLGLGKMGSAFVKNLLHSKHKVILWNRTPEKVVPFLKLGAQCRDTPADVVAEADVTVSCVSDMLAVYHLLYGQGNVLSNIKNKCYVEMTSIEPNKSIMISQEIHKNGGKYLEAQIRGTGKQAILGTLTILTAGDKEIYDQCQTFFEAICRVSYYFGPVGKACQLNLCSQLFSGIYVSSFLEVFNLSLKLGHDLDTIEEMMDIFAPKSDSIINILKKLKSFQTHPDLDTMMKDIDLALESSKESSMVFPVSSIANEVLKTIRKDLE